MARWIGWGAAALCAGAATGALAQAFVESSSGSHEDGSYVFRVYSDDRIEIVSTGGQGLAEDRSETAGALGGYAKALALVLEEAPKLPAGDCPGGVPQRVAISPPRAAFSELVTTCRTAEMDALRSRIEAFAFDGG